MTSFWQRIYDSPWHQPALVVAMSLAALGYAWSTRRRDGAELARVLGVWTAFFGVEVMVDAVLTASNSPLLPAHAGWLQTFSIGFVLLGDVQAYVLAERATRPDADATRAVALGVAWGALVSVLMAAPARLVPLMQQNARWIYLSYELLALTQALTWCFVVLPRRAAVGEARVRWARAVMGFVAVQYGLWALADVLILSGVSAGHGLRLVPNVMYYGAFVGFVWVTGQRALQGR
jgi:hypothetical protein